MSRYQVKDLTSSRRGWGRRVGQYVADMDLFFPMLDRLATLSDGDRPAAGLSFTKSEMKIFADQGNTDATGDARRRARGDALASYARPVRCRR